MKRKSFYAILNLLLCLLFYHFSSAQANLPDCYATYKTQGDSFNLKQNYSLARQQYEIAKNCNYLTNLQRIQIDSLIADINKRQPQPKIKSVDLRKG